MHIRLMPTSEAIFDDEWFWIQTKLKEPMEQIVACRELEDRVHEDGFLSLSDICFVLGVPHTTIRYLHKYANAWLKEKIDLENYGYYSDENRIRFNATLNQLLLPEPKRYEDGA